jgi:hypothetical protein
MEAESDTASEEHHELKKYGLKTSAMAPPYTNASMRPHGRKKAA